MQVSLPTCAIDGFQMQLQQIDQAAGSGVAFGCTSIGLGGRGDVVVLRGVEDWGIWRCVVGMNEGW